MIYFTSDLHFGHAKEFLWRPRGFNSIEEHDEAIISNWNSVIEPQDTVYILGDLTLDKEYARGVEKINFLNGNKIIVRGNHDTEVRLEWYKDMVFDLKDVQNSIYFAPSRKFRFYLSHYPVLLDNDQNPSKRWCLCGHSHTKNKWMHEQFNCYHVELDAHDNYPVSLDEVMSDIYKMNEGRNNNGKV